MCAQPADGSRAALATDPVASGGGRDAALCIHIGMPKTATSLLQRFLFPAHSEINALGKVLSGPERWPLRAGRCLARTSNLKAGLPDWAASELRASIEAASEAGKTSVFSKEGLCTLDPEASRRFAELVRDRFGSCRVLYTIREPLSFLEALYFQHLKSFQRGKRRDYLRFLGLPPRYFDFDRWLFMTERVGRSPLRATLGYADTADAYASVFGKDRVKVLVYEQLRADPKAFIGELCHFLEIGVEEALALSGQREANVRWSEENIRRLRACESSLGSRWRYRLSRPPQRDALLGLADSGAAPPSPRARVELEPGTRQRILEICRPQLRRLASEWSLPLHLHGYDS